ncbi:hypothetical protein BP00DRAFT_444586 [Aspergillus indologenus CBS 114.80]|uniref:Uncharacterized protein n=1 Tax=Aspergillus indologenus CBS 114.80 TaxID=1450541 RepID=A0A2V5IHM9_9EURO|nr:hypothetical protein BP00DRAFT_444586 [Aspergillus indologenus CBS 114.80]
MITNFFAKAAATGGNQTQDGTGPVADSLLGARTSVLPTGHIEMDAGLLAVGGVQNSLATPKTPNKSDDKVTSGNGSTTNPLNRRPPPRSRVNKRTNKAKPTKGRTQQVEKGLQQIDKMFQIETRAPSASQPRLFWLTVTSPTRDHGKSEPMHVPYDSFYPEDQENWDWGVMIPSQPRPRSKYAKLLRPDWMKRDVNEAQVSKSIAEDVANDEEEFYDWSSSPPRPARREAEEGRESLYTQKHAPAEVETEQFADESSDVVDSEVDSENERPEEDDNEWEDIEEEENIDSKPLDIDEFPPRRPDETHEKYVYRVLNLEPDDVEARQIIFRYRLEGIIRHTWTLARQTPLEDVANNSPFVRPMWSILANTSEEKIDEVINKIEFAIIPVDQLEGVYLDLVTNTRFQKDNGLYIGSAVSVPKKWVD